MLRFFTTAVEAFGHTPGMLAFNISSGSESVFYSADTLHHFALYIVHPEWHVGFDNDQELAPAPGYECSIRSLLKDR